MYIEKAIAILLISGGVHGGRQKYFPKANIIVDRFYLVNLATMFSTTQSAESLGWRSIG